MGRILELIAALPSSTVPADRTLSNWLTQRLQQVADHHGGVIPLHGRLFGQWMHYAFPRECPFPHVLGTTRPQTAEAWVRETRRDFSANKTEMQHYIAKPTPHQRRVTETGELDEVLSMESAMWTMEEELVVHREVQPAQRSSLGSWLRGAVFSVALLSGLMALKNSVDSK